MYIFLQIQPCPMYKHIARVIHADIHADFRLCIVVRQGVCGCSEKQRATASALFMYTQLSERATATSLGVH